MIIICILQYIVIFNHSPYIGKRTLGKNLLNFRVYKIETKDLMFYVSHYLLYSITVNIDKLKYYIVLENNIIVKSIYYYNCYKYAKNPN